MIDKSELFIFMLKIDLKNLTSASMDCFKIILL